MNCTYSHTLFLTVLPRTLTLKVACICGFAFVLLLNRLDAQESSTLPDSLRVTTVVRVIHVAEPAITSLFIPIASGQLISGSGTIIHPDGYILTNNHVVQNADGFALIGSDLPGEQKPIRFRVVGRLPEKDLAIVRLIANRSFPTVPLGRSNDLLNGESVVVAGNPGGRGLVFTSGIVSSRKVLTGTPNALVMTNYANSRRDTLIQFDAASNGGNSGGPLINMEGQLIGVVSSKVLQEQNIGFAIPADDVHNTIEQILEPELKARKQVGLHIAESVSNVAVDRVIQNSAAAAVGLQAGDVLTEVNGRVLHHKVDWFLELTSLLREAETFDVTVERGEETLKATIRPTELLPMPAAKVSGDTLMPGLAYRFYHGEYSLLPDFEQQTLVREGVVKTIDLPAIQEQRADHFAVALNGFLRIPDDDLYRLIVVSDDGSKVYLDDEVIIDHDGNHPPTPAGKLLYLQKGFHTLRIGHFEGNGGQELQLMMHRIGADPQQVPAEMLWHLP